MLFFTRCVGSALLVCLSVLLSHDQWSYTSRRRLACSFDLQTHKELCSASSKTFRTSLDQQKTENLEVELGRIYDSRNLATPPPLSCGLRHVAILLVGNNKPIHFKLHAEHMSKFIMKPLGAHIFSVTDDNGGKIFSLHDSETSTEYSLAEGLPYVFGRQLKIVGLVSTTRSKCETCVRLNQNEDTNITSFVGLPGPGERFIGPLEQWYKIHKAWQLMARYEKEIHGSKYDVVIKLQFDCTPLGNWNLCGSDAIKLKTKFSAIHACTDHVFWGRREAMMVAALEIFPAIDKYFRHGRPNAMQRSMSVPAMLGSLLATPHELHTRKLKNGWKHYNKIGSLPYIDLHAPPELPNSFTYNDMINNMELARERGFTYVNPLSPEFKNLTFRRGVQSSSKYDYSQDFRSEKDFLVWMILNNVTVCDLAAETTSILYKGGRILILFDSRRIPYDST
jgi:hypothetical protein